MWVVPKKASHNWNTKWHVTVPVVFNLDTPKIGSPRNKFFRNIWTHSEKFVPTIGQQHKGKSVHVSGREGTKQGWINPCQSKMLFPFASNWIAAMAEKNAKCSNKVMDSRDDEDEILIYIFLVVALGAEVLLCIMLSGLLLNDKQ